MKKDPNRRPGIPSDMAADLKSLYDQVLELKYAEVELIKASTRIGEAIADLSLKMKTLEWKIRGEHLE